MYEVIVDEAEGRINYCPIEIESEKSNCFRRILTEIDEKITVSNDFPTH